ncbi:DUF4430 domain-containing protein [Candidatus Gottesmanbacteria bacterium]|nr:DUF4430 domain-containing protein [Candidatus Gottesmanbacteria bacterium]
MNRFMKGFILILVGTIILAVFVLPKNGWFDVEKENTGKAVQVEKKHITMVIDFGDRVRSYTGVEASTVFEGLKNIYPEVEVKTYDFGMLVTKIEGKQNSPTHAWLYWVNGKEATLSADMYITEDGDMVEWKYVSLTQ